MLCLDWRCSDGGGAGQWMCSVLNKLLWWRCSDTTVICWTFSFHWSFTLTWDDNSNDSWVITKRMNLWFTQLFLYVDAISLCWQSLHTGELWWWKQFCLRRAQSITWTFFLHCECVFLIFRRKIFSLYHDCVTHLWPRCTVLISHVLCLCQFLIHCESRWFCFFSSDQNRDRSGSDFTSVSA